MLLAGYAGQGRMDREISETGCRQIAESAGLDKRGKVPWMGFFVFLPGIGDFYRVALGFLRANIWIVAVSMFLGRRSDIGFGWNLSISTGNVLIIPL